MSMKLQNAVTVIYDRKNVSSKKGTGKLEIRIYLSREQRKYITVGNASPLEWQKVAKRPDVTIEVAKYKKIVEAMQILGEDMTIENFDAHLLYNQVQEENAEKNMFNGYNLKEDFIEYVRDFIENEDCASATLKHKRVVLHSLEDFGRIQTYEDLTPTNIKAYDRWLHNGARTDVTISQYHKYVHYYINTLLMEERIPSDPYKKVHIKKGESKMRQPLTEQELIKVRDAKLTREKLDRVRDLFIFMAYTGLSYADTQYFNFKEMAVYDEEEKMYYIDGRRMKTKTEYFTPILPPALAVLKKNDYHLMKISNQKANDHLHTIQEKLEISHSMTCHIARHSFATLCLSHGVSMESVSKMLGHTNLKTTQRYAKVLQSTIRQQTVKLVGSLM